LQEVKVLRDVFGDMAPDKVDPVKVYQFLDRRGKVAPTRANREKALLSHVFTKAIRWGVVKENPCRDVESLPSTKRDRYITHEEFNNVKSIADENMKNILDFAYLTGLRQADILKVKLEDISADGIYVHVSKTKNKLRIIWSERLKALVDRAIELAQSKNAEYLFSNDQGRKYASSGFQSNFQKLQRKAIGHFYAILFLNFDSDNPIKQHNWAELSKVYGGVPILIKHTDEYWFWGCKAAKTWQLTRLTNITTELNFIQSDAIHLLKRAAIPEQFYAEITAANAHIDPRKILEERFTFHDIRRKAATDLEAKKDREAARKLLGHSDQRMTGNYISGVQSVLPVE